MIIITLMRGAFLNRNKMAAKGEVEAAEDRGVRAARSSVRKRMLEDRQRKLGDQQLMLVPEKERERRLAEQQRVPIAEEQQRKPDEQQRVPILEKRRRRNAGDEQLIPAMNARDRQPDAQQRTPAPDRRQPMPAAVYERKPSAVAHQPKLASEIRPFKRISDTGQHKRMFIARHRKRMPGSPQSAREPAILRDQ